MKSILQILIAFSFLSFSGQRSSSKKSEFQRIIDNYQPSNSIIIANYPESTINMLARGDSLKEYVFSLTSVLHEAYHTYSFSYLNSNNHIRKYRLNDTLTISINKFRSFPSKKINKVVTDSNNVDLFRYNTYVNTDLKTHDTQQNGFLGLLEEYTAYYQEFKIYIGLFDFLKQKYGFSDATLWQRYLCDIGSVRYSLDEFEIFTRLYLETAEVYYPEIFKVIDSDKEIERLIDFLESENNKLKELYQVNRLEILEKMNGKLILKGEWLTCNQITKGIHDNQAKITEAFLSELKE